MKTNFIFSKYNFIIKEIEEHAKLLYDRAVDDDLYVFEFTINLPTSLEYYDTGDSILRDTSCESNFNDLTSKHHARQKKPVSAIDSETGDLIYKLVFPKLLKFIFGNKYHLYKEYHPVGIGYYEKKFKEKINENNISNLRKQISDNYIDNPHVHFVMCVKDRTPCGIEIIERLEQFFIKHEIVQIRNSIIELHIEPVTKTFDDIKSAMFYNAEMIIREREKFVSDQGDVMFTYFLSPPKTSNLYKPYEKTEQERLNNVQELMTWKKHSNPLMPVHDKLAVSRKQDSIAA